MGGKRHRRWRVCWSNVAWLLQYGKKTTFLHTKLLKLKNQRKKKKNQFYRIPKDSKQRKIWLHRPRRKFSTPSPSTRLCSEHFVGGWKSSDPKSTFYLPSVFSYKKSVKRRSSRNSESATLNDQVPTELEPKGKRKREVVKWFNIILQEVEKAPTMPKFELESTVWGQCLPESMIT